MFTKKNTKFHALAAPMGQPPIHCKKTISFTEACTSLTQLMNINQVGWHGHCTGRTWRQTVVMDSSCIIHADMFP